LIGECPICGQQFVKKSLGEKHCLTTVHLARAEHLDDTEKYARKTDKQF